MTYQLERVTTEADWTAYDDIRRRMLFENPALPSNYRPGVYKPRHKDEFLPANTPLLFKLAGKPIGTVRLDDRGDRTAVVRLVAIDGELQGQGHGRAFSDKLDGYAAERGFKTLYVNAAPEATGYYYKTGWQDFVWDASELTGMAADCTQMRKPIGPQP